MPVSTLADLADALLTEASAGLDVARTGHPNFARQFVSHNAPAWEVCAASQLTVHTASLSHRQPTTKAPCMIWPRLELHVQFVRCVTTEPIEGPDAAALDVDATGLLVDLQALVSWLYDHPIGGACEEIQFGNAIPLGPSGGIAGYDVAVFVGVNDSA